MTTHNSFRTGILVILFAVVLPFGCQQGSTGDIVGATDNALPQSLQRASSTGIDAESRPASGQSLQDDLEDTDSHWSGKHKKGTATRIVTPSRGGTLRLMNSKLVLFPGSVSEPVSVSWTIENDAPEGLKGALQRIYRFSPDGLVFNTPGKAYISFKDAGLGKRNPNSYRFYYFNESTGKWERQKTQVNIFLKQFVVTMHHFSRYAFGR